MQINYKGDDPEIKLTVSETRALRSKQYILRGASRNIPGELGDRLAVAADTIEEFDELYGSESERLEREDADQSDRPDGASALKNPDAD